jgi:signal peptidase II
MPLSASSANPKRKLGGEADFPLTPNRNPVRHLGLSGALLLFDQLTKVWALQSLPAEGSVPIIPGVFHLTLIHNTGVAFGLFAGLGTFVTWLSAAVLLGLLWALLQSHSTISGAMRIGMLLIVGGAAGNLLDRIRIGEVIDFLDFQIWPVFNVADIGITCGAALLCWQLIKKK